jgi:hypothetical protein
MLCAARETDTLIEMDDDEVYLPPRKGGLLFRDLRFDDTNTSLTLCKPGGWAFLGMIRDSIRRAASAAGKAWPYSVAENSGGHTWDASGRGFGLGLQMAYAIGPLALLSGGMS